MRLNIRLYCNEPTKKCHKDENVRADEGSYQRRKDYECNYLRESRDGGHYRKYGRVLSFVVWKCVAKTHKSTSWDESWPGGGESNS